MSADGFIVISDKFDAALQRLIATSKKSAVEVMRDQARLLFGLVAKITPPGNEFASGRAAEKQGTAAVAADIYALYGTPGDAYQAILDQGFKDDADAFWALMKNGKEWEAENLFNTATGKHFQAFDDGAKHKSTTIGKRKRRLHRPSLYTFQTGALKDYVEKVGDRVWWLASGWAKPLRSLAVRLPTGVGKHQAPGDLEVKIDGRVIEIKMINQVRFAGGVRGLRRRIKSALNIRAKVLQRRWDYHIGRAARRSGFRTR